MKICISAKQANIDSELDPRFGRAQSYLIYDTETQEAKALLNSGVDATGGAGTSAAQLMATENVSAVISGNFGPNASKGLNGLGIEMYVSKVTSIKDVISNFKSGQLEKITAATVEGHQS